jgi:ABC-type nickel/cobalt efflux system permease component RcnA
MFRNLLILLLLLAGITALFSQSNPFLSTGEGGSREEPETRVTAPAAPRPSNPVLTRISAVQRRLQRSISSALEDASSGKDPGALFLVSGLAFLYGFIHALGPGHRKTVLLGYFLGEKARPAAGIITGLLLALAHAGSALILVGGLSWLAVNSMLISINRAEQYLYPATYAIISLLGIWMLVQGIREFHGHEHGESRHSIHPGTGGIILSGLVPCPGASAIMIFSIASGGIWVGIIAVLAMSLGMGIVLAGIGLASILFRGRIAALIRNEKAGRNLELLLHLGGGILIAGFGLLLLAGSLAG